MEHVSDKIRGTPRPKQSHPHVVRATLLRLWSSWVGDAGLGAILFLLPFLFFWRFITPNLADRVTFARGDFVGQYFPLRYFVATQFGQGQLPLWNPYIYGGQPAAADIQSAAFYLPNAVLALLLGGDGFTVPALEFQVILHFSLAACFTFLFARRLTGDRFAAVVSSLAYTYGGYMTSFPVRQMTMLGVGVWLPLILLFLDTAIDRLLRRADAPHGMSWLAPIILAGAAFSVSILGGHPQTSLYVAYFCAAYVLYRLWPLRGSGSIRARIGRGLRNLLPFALVLVIGAGLSAVQLLPTLEFIQHSTRAELTYETVSWGLPIHELVSLLYPGYGGNSPQYVGILPMILVGAAVFLPRRWKDQGFWAATAIISLLLSLGGNTFLFSFFYNAVPGFQNVRDQERVVFLFAFSVSVLAGYGAKALTQQIGPDPGKQIFRMRHGIGRFAAAMLALTALFLYGWAQNGDIFSGVLRHHMFGLLLFAGVIIWLAAWPRTPRGLFLWKTAAIALIVLNLFTVNWEFHMHDIPEQGFFPETSTTAFLREQQSARTNAFRISGAGLLPGGSSAGAVYGLRDITGNSPLHLDSFDRFSARMGEWRMWQLLNVLYVIDSRDLDSPGLQRVHEEGDLKVYEVTDPFPQAWVVHDARSVDNDEDALALLNTDSFDLRRSATVDRQVDLGSESGSGSTAQVVQQDAQYIAIEAQMNQSGLLVLSEIYFPGWRAELDGQPVPVLRANMVLRGVPVPAGTHHIELSYAPASFALGKWLSISTLLACIAGLLWSLGTRYRRPSRAA